MGCCCQVLQLTANEVSWWLGTDNPSMVANLFWFASSPPKQRFFVAKRIMELTFGYL